MFVDNARNSEPHTVTHISMLAIYVFGPQLLNRPPSAMDLNTEVVGEERPAEYCGQRLLACHALLSRKHEPKSRIQASPPGWHRYQAPLSARPVSPNQIGRIHDTP